MNSLLVATLILSGGTLASYNDAASEVYSAASIMGKDVDDWNSAKGLQGALAIQENFPALSTALSHFSGSAKDISAEDVDIHATQQFSAILTSLLKSLTDKAADFKSVSLSEIATNDLNQLSGPTTDVINNLQKALSNNQSKWDSLSEGINNLENQLNSANKAFDVKELHFDSNPTFTTETHHTSPSSAPKKTSSSSTTGITTVSAIALKNTTKSASNSTTTVAAKPEHSHNSSSSGNSASRINPEKNVGAATTVGIFSAAIGLFVLLL